LAFDTADRKEEEEGIGAPPAPPVSEFGNTDFGGAVRTAEQVIAVVGRLG
jgi:hypothetical protein